MPKSTLINKCHTVRDNPPLSPGFVSGHRPFDFAQGKLSAVDIDLRDRRAQLLPRCPASLSLRRTGAGPYFSLLGGTAEQAAEKV